MAQSFDAIIVGLGAMGSAAAYHLARRGQRILGLDRFTPPHSFGSSHGQTRFIREAYFEHPAYVPLVQAAYQRWAELEKESQRTLFRQTGGLMIGPAEGVLVSGAQHSAEVHGLAYERLTADDIRRRFPAFQPGDEMVAVWEPRAGILFPEACIQAHLEMAGHRGATLHFDEKVLSWHNSGEGVRVVTSKGEYQARRLLLTAGAWINQLVPELGLPLSVERQVIVWFAPSRPEHLSPDRCPIWIIEYEPSRFLYGFPDLGEGVKAGLHHDGETVDPETVRRDIRSDEIHVVQSLVRRFLPGAGGPARTAAVCLYTNTPDFHFLIDTHPNHPHVLIASPCSGHGFKFAGVLGEVLSDLLIEGRSPLDLSFFRLDRFVITR
jgi:sarcosine oxidase